MGRLREEMHVVALNGEVHEAEPETCSAAGEGAPHGAHGAFAAERGDVSPNFEGDQHGMVRAEGRPRGVGDAGAIGVGLAASSFPGAAVCSEGEVELLGAVSFRGRHSELEIAYIIFAKSQGARRPGCSITVRMSFG